MSRNLLKHVIIGGIATTMDFTLFLLLTEVFAAHYLAAGAFSFTCGTLLSYFISIRFLFASGSRFAKNNEILAAVCVGMLGLLLHQIILLVCVANMGVLAFSEKNSRNRNNPWLEFLSQTVLRFSKAALA